MKGLIIHLPNGELLQFKTGDHLDTYGKKSIVNDIYTYKQCGLAIIVMQDGTEIEYGGMPYEYVSR